MSTISMSMPRAVLVSICTSVAALGLSACVSAQEPMSPEDAVEAADARFAHFFDNNQVPLAGVSITVMRAGDVLYNASLGVRNVDTQAPATPDTRYRIYSTSKALTAAAAMRLAELGRLDIDAPISDVMPDLPEHFRALTARQLMAHRSGVRHYNPGEWVGVSSSDCAGPRDAMPVFQDDALNFSPGSENQYTTFGFVLLSAVIEAAAGQTYEAAMEELVFAPSGMTMTAIEGRPLPGHPVATFYFYQAEDEPNFFDTSEYDPPILATCKFGGGGYVSSSEDLARFGDALLRGALMSDEQRNEMWRLHTPNGEGAGVALGFFDGEHWLRNLDAWRASEGDLPDEPRHFTPAWFHGGASPGGNSYLFIYPEQDLVIAAAMTNSAGGNIAMLDMHDIASEFFRPRVEVP